MIQRVLVSVIACAVALGSIPTAAAAQHFGRNKVQYRSFDWNVIETEHFDVYFYPQERAAVQDAARMIERAYARISRLLQHEFEERKPIILYASHSDFQQTNALRGRIPGSTLGATEPIKDRIVMPFTGSYQITEDVLTHELVHAFQFDILYGQSSVMGGGGVRLPLWFMEGMAEYLALGEVNVITATWLRDAVLSGYLYSIAQMFRRQDYLSYRFGQALWTYIGATWGDEVVGILLQKAARMPLENAFNSTLGITLQQLNREWSAAVRKQYLPQVVRFDGPTEIAEPLLRHESFTDPSYLAPALSPDGDLMAVFTAREGFFRDLWLVDARTGEFIRRLVQSGRSADFESLRYMQSSAAFSPDGRYLAFSAQTGGRDALYIYDLDEEDVVRKIRFKLNTITNPTWSPDGTRIAFSGVDGGITDLYWVDLEDGTLERLTNDRYADLLPAWSPDGRTIAFSTDRGPATDFESLTFSNLRVALYDIETGDIRVLPHQLEGTNLNPVWSPDSRALIWVSDRTGIKNLYLYERDGRRLSRISSFLSGVMGPTATDLSPVLSWARDADRLAFIYFERAGHSVFTVQDPRSLEGVPVSELPERDFAAPYIARTGDTETPASSPEPVELAANDKEPKGPVHSFYRTEADFRPSAILPPDAVETGPISITTLLDSAQLALPDTTAFEIRDYDLDFSPDIIGRPTVGAQVGGYYGNGAFGSSFIALSDMLGNHRILLAGSLRGSLSDAMFYAGYNFLKTRTNFGVSLLQFPMYGRPTFCSSNCPGMNQGVSGLLLQRNIVRQAQGIMKYPFSTFRRLEFGVTGTHLDRDAIFRGFGRNRVPFEEERDLGSAWWFEPMAALVYDNTLFGWTGPIAGRRYRLSLSRSFGDSRFTEGLIDFRNYLNFDRKVVFASRVIGLIRSGDNANVFPSYWGGSYFIRGYKPSSFNRRSRECNAYPGTNLVPCPMRAQLIGSSAALFNLEVRFPIITELQLGFIGRFPPVDAVVFFDGGVAWDDAVCLQSVPNNRFACQTERDVHLVWDRQPGQSPLLYREPLFSTGVGLRINVFFAILRLDYTFPLSRPEDSPIFSISFGPSF